MGSATCSAGLQAEPSGGILPGPAPGDVQVVIASLDDRNARAGAERVLSADDLARAARFRFARDRDRFVAGRALLRRSLGRYLGRPADELELDYGLRGKPRVGGADAEAGLCFNVSHSGGTALFAYAWERELGVDVERYPAPFDGDDVARHFFAPAEVARLDRLGAAERSAGFLRCWTRKEAYIKARGDGLYLPLDGFEVSLEPAAPAALLVTRGDIDDGKRWSLVDLTAHVTGHVAALAIAGGLPRVRVRAV